MQSSITSRYSDVVMAVNIAENYDHHLTKIHLQKFIYLVDALSVVWKFIKQFKGHETYKHGPYDQNIQNAVDTLAFRGFIKIDDFEYQDNGNVSCRYGLTKVGKDLIDQLVKQSYFEDRFEMFQIIGEEVNSKGWRNLVDLVYAEPTYLAERQSGWGRPIILDSMLTNQSLQMISMIENVASAFDNELPPKTLVSLYFEMLANAAGKKKHIVGDEYE